MKMTYFRMPLDVRKMIDIEMKMDKRTYQAVIGDILHGYFEKKIHLFRLCGIIADKSNIEVDDLYLAAIKAEHGGELSNLLPQIKTDLPVLEALDDLTKRPIDRVWIGLDNNSSPCCAYLSQPEEGIRTIELPIK